MSLKPGNTRLSIKIITKSRERSCTIGEKGVEHFDPRGVCLWPSEDAPSELLALLCPDSSTGLVRAVCDERSLMYSTSAERLPPTKTNPHHYMLVLINSDPMIRFHFLTSLRKQKARKSTRKVLDAPRPDLYYSRPLVQNAKAFHLAILAALPLLAPVSPPQAGVVARRLILPSLIEISIQQVIE